MLSPDACLPSAVGRQWGAIALLSQQPRHSQLLRATIAWRLGWGGDGESREGAQPAPQCPGAAGAQHHSCALSLLCHSGSWSPVCRLQCVLEEGHCCPSLRCALLLLLAFAAGTLVFEPIQPHKQIIKLFFSRPEADLSPLNELL